MYIPLDYYRILGLPIQATPEQLRQSHRDRTLQLPRREYSDAAIASRKQLLDEAHAILANPEQRQSYDASFLAKTYNLVPEVPSALNGDTGSRTALADDRTDAHTPSIEIHDQQLIGALLILQELGEYELVLKLGRPFLTGGSASVKEGRFGDPKIVYADIVLTVALACLELGREQWQQGQYENAAEALETGQQLLLREGLFAGVRGEVQADLLKLRPYRVLELLALPESQLVDRQRGIQLLKSMLQERGGIDGTAADQSGLNVDDFLRFVQQLRSYLTVAEQQELFEAESQRPSAVATYLAVYALLARGFAEREPGLVQRAKLLLQRLGSRQDVHLEQAVCTLLLGQTEAASRALELSQEYESIAYIREHSQGSPDLLPGLCLYAERWLQEEVFPHFRDLANQRAALKDYFADRQVQGYLETLPPDQEVARELAPVPTRFTPTSAPENSPQSEMRSSGGWGENQFAAPSSPRQEGNSGSDSLVEVARARIAARSAGITSDRPTSERSTGGVATMPPAERLDSGATTPEGSRSSLRPRSDRGQAGRPNGISPNESDKGSRKEFHPSSLLFPVLMVLGLLTLGVGATWAFRNWKIAKSPTPEQTLPTVQVSPLPSAASIPTPSVKPSSDAILTERSAQEVIQSWLTAKAAALGQKHDTEKLEQVLIDPKLSYWKSQAQVVSRDKSYIVYKHGDVKVSKVDPSKEKLDQAKVTAEVSEVREEYDESGKLRNSASDQDLKIRYSLLRKEGEWRIQDWEVLP